jgi:hypothetical protein
MTDNQDYVNSCSKTDAVSFRNKDYHFANHDSINLPIR